MKNFTRAFTCFVFVAALLIGSFSSTKACDRSEFRLDSLIFNGSSYTVHTTLCVGAGILGAVRGGDNNTTNLFFMAWGSPTLLMTGFTPTVTSDTTNCTMSGTLGGPIGSGPLAGVRTRVTYTPTTACTYACVTSTAGCGRPHTDCKQFTFTFNELPDTLRALGIEGTGSPFAGCFRPDDMAIDFTILPVIWASIDARIQGEAVEVDWSTEMEANNRYFRVMRSGNGSAWDELDRIDAIGNTAFRSNYSFYDEQPLQGTNQYKIIQVDIDGRSSESEVVTVNFDIGSKYEWRQIGPVPTADVIDIAFMAPRSERVSLQVVGMDGSVVEQVNIDAAYGLNKLSIDLSHHSSGVYFLRLNSSRGMLNKKVIKI